MKTIKIALGTLFVFGLLAFASRSDWSEEVVMSIPQEAYEAICVKLPNGASNYEIATEYMNNKSYYDSLSE